MTLHCDMYSVPTNPQTMEQEIYGEPRRLDDPGLNARAWGLPYFNGYTWTTEMHEDGECDQHRPALRRRPLEPS